MLPFRDGTAPIIDRANYSESLRAENLLTTHRECATLDNWSVK